MSDSTVVTSGRGLPLHTKVMIGFLLGLTIGLTVHYGLPQAAWVAGSIQYVAQPVGSIFLSLLFMMVLPLMLTALILGVAELSDVASLGRLGGRLLKYILFVTLIAVVIGLTLVNVIQPGVGLDGPQMLASLTNAEDAARAQAIAQAGGGISPMDVLLSIVPKNVVAAMADDKAKLAVMFFALAIGVGLVLTPSPATRHFKQTVQGLFEITMTLIGGFIKLAPYAVFALIYALCAKLGVDPLLSLLKFVITVVLGLAIHLFVVLPIWVKWKGGMSPREFFRGAQEAIVTAFATASSSATLPVSLRVAEQKLKVPPRIARFTVTIGCSASHHGTSLFEGVTVLFLAQAFGVDLDLSQQLLVVGLCILGGIGTASVPAGSLPVIAMILMTVGIPAEGLAIILGVDRFLDMCRTTLNVTGDLAMAVVMGKQAGGDPAVDVPDPAALASHGHPPTTAQG